MQSHGLCKGGSFSQERASSAFPAELRRVSSLQVTQEGLSALHADPDPVPLPGTQCFPTTQRLPRRPRLSWGPCLGASARCLRSERTRVHLHFCELPARRPPGRPLGGARRAGRGAAPRALGRLCAQTPGFPREGARSGRGETGATRTPGARPRAPPRPTTTAARCLHARLKNPEQNPLPTCRPRAPPRFFRSGSAAAVEAEVDRVTSGPLGTPLPR